MKVEIGIDSSLKPVYRDLVEFLSIPVHINGAQDCDRFILSLCHQLDLCIHPEQCTDRAPWKYTPYKEQGKHVACVTMGTVCTSIGNYTIAYTSKEKNNIDSVYFYNYYGAHNSNKGKLKNIVRNAITERNKTEEFRFRVKLNCPIENIIGWEYIGSNFRFTYEDASFWLIFRINAIDKREAFDLGILKLRMFLAFLSMETNLCFSSEKLIDEDTPWLYQSNENECQFFNDFIDCYSISGNTLGISYYGYKFIDMYIFNFREFTDNYEAQCVLNGSSHIYEGMLSELKLGENLHAYLPELVLMVKPTEAKYQLDVTKSLMCLMSALEVSTLPDGSSDVCSNCGTTLYHISHRIKDIATKYLGAELGTIFTRLYSMRSKYLHTGFFSTGIDQIHVRPQYDAHTATGLIDAGFISVGLNGKTNLINLMNAKEWTTYILRCYYQEKLFQKTEFKGFEADNNNSQSLVPNIGSVEIRVMPEFSNLQIEKIVLT